MGRTCDIIGCTNSNYKTKKMSYHSLPSDELLRGLWLDAINANGGFRQSKTRKKTHNCDNTFICGEHFSDDCYIPTSKQKHLKPTAVPTFPPLKKRRCIENDILEVYIHEDDESQSKGTPEPSNRDDSSPKAKQASKSKNKKAAEISRKSKSPVLSESVLTNVDQCREDLPIISCINYTKETVFVIEKCAPSETHSIAGTVEHLESEISNGFRTLEIFEINLQRIFNEKQELELEKSLKHLMEKKEEVQQKLAHRREEKLTKEMAWNEEQESVFELQQNLLNDDKNTEHLKEMEKILAEREEEIKQLRYLANDEILVIEGEVKDLDKRISEFQDSRSTKLKELLNQESILHIKKKDLIKDLKEKVLTVKVLEAKLIENKAEERFEKLDRLQCSHGEMN